ncbi:MAG: aminotransferase class III-fold pyridoxal phosphate-dependent enzyme [Rhodospirillales bacterium]|nr:MAG: aminotransferase class III-fold pyridoxal phosphate-dependent enzyme [Rhodospirillales bacterium]
MAAVPAETPTNSTIAADYRARTPTSAKLFARANKILPSGITHDGRHLDPYPLYVTRGMGARKWCADGHEYVDYFGGHGALILGHSHPAVVEAVQRQMALGTHLGGSHELEVRWAEQVRRMIPCAEKVRFTSSGTEASHMALRLARAFTGKPRIMRFTGHFHGWHDQVVPGGTSHFDGGTPVGIDPALVGLSAVMPTDDPAPAVKLLEEADDIAAVMIEPSGASWGQVPLPPGFLHALRDATSRRGVLLIFDEVITGFRWSTGGAQKAFGITPDMCILAKIVAGGLPGGAVAGRGDVLDLLDFAATKAAKREKIAHPGTYNANPLSAAAAVTALEIVEREDAPAKANATTAKLRDAMRQVLIEEGVPWGVYGQSSAFQIFTNPNGVPIDPATFDPLKLGFKGLKGARDPAYIGKVRMALLAHGVDVMGGPGGLVSAVHGDADIDRTASALRASVRALMVEREIRGM